MDMCTTESFIYTRTCPGRQETPLLRRLFIYLLLCFCCSLLLKMQNGNVAPTRVYSKILENLQSHDEVLVSHPLPSKPLSAFLLLLLGTSLSIPLLFPLLHNPTHTFIYTSTSSPYTHFKICSSKISLNSPPEKY